MNSEIVQLLRFKEGEKENRRKGEKKNILEVIEIH